MRLITVWLAALLGLAGCTSVPVELQIRTGARIATVGTLIVIDAQPDQVETVRAIAEDVVALVNETGYVDWVAVQATIVTQIRMHFSGRNAEALVALAGDVAALVIAALNGEPDGDQQSKLLLYTRYAAEGVREGCDIYAPRPSAPP